MTPARMRQGRIDVHAHLLPGLDDGCADESQSIACAKALVDSGYTHAFCTPHFWPSLPDNTVSSILSATAKLQKRFKSENIPLTLLPGAEINLLESWPDIRSLRNEQVPTYAMAGQYVLFDFWADTYAECRADLEAAIDHLKDRGFKPILAHPERIRAMRDPTAIDRMSELGILIQLNSYCLSDSVDSKIFQTAKRLLEEDRYFLIGTDTHRPAGMTSRTQGLEVAIRLVGKEAVDRLTIQNPLKLLAGLDPPT
jgi:protein-tyrosine phosphatase